MNAPKPPELDPIDIEVSEDERGGEVMAMLAAFAIIGLVPLAVMVLLWLLMVNN